MMQQHKTDPATVIKGDPNQVPPVGSIGIAWVIEGGKIAFIPNDKSHYPLGKDDEDFDFYMLDAEEVSFVRKQ